MAISRNCWWDDLKVSTSIRCTRHEHPVATCRGSGVARAVEGLIRMLDDERDVKRQQITERRPGDEPL